MYRWLFALFLGIDANFRMCRRNKSSEEADPSLSKGWAYFVEESGFKRLLAEHAGQTQEVSNGLLDPIGVLTPWSLEKLLCKPQCSELGGFQERAWPRSDRHRCCCLCEAQLQAAICCWRSPKGREVSIPSVRFTLTNNLSDT